ncbi:MAG: amidohydrolase, partial [Bacteroidales bacterium]|nr:amidohydrolase [Bacteroidales bacterium]
MGSLLIKDVRLDGRIVDVLIADGRFRNLQAPPGTVADKTVDARGLAMLPPFYNTHTHAAMSLLRGY